MNIKFSIYLLFLFQMLFSSELSVLTYNIHALSPLFSRDDPEGRLEKILTKSRDIDLLFIQENWIFKNKELEVYSFADRIISSNKSKFPWPLKSLINPNGSGLSLIINKNIRVLDIREELFKKCSGWLSQENDCFSTKGFQHIQIELDGSRVDLYNTHLDAGISKKDIVARKSQIEHITRYIQNNSMGYPLIIAGDFNVNFFGDEKLILSWFMDELDLDIADWVGANNDNLEVLDYIFFRASGEVDISLLGSDIDTRLDGLSDHPAIRAEFNIGNK